MLNIFVDKFIKVKFELVFLMVCFQISHVLVKLIEAAVFEIVFNDKKIIHF